ncbi:hypothetical protein AMTRI_Chr09g38810 [Amborella trichopoda]|uniref:Uncharacterized protein n=1 Tax=Amborella trichopoda TaxID=13333 RepID=U5CY19_AMBTC|nr:hypothetical protein AMTR_s00055p00097380 [Amborella trichopoda]
MEAVIFVADRPISAYRETRNPVAKTGGNNNMCCSPPPTPPPPAAFKGNNSKRKSFTKSPLGPSHGGLKRSDNNSYKPPLLPLPLNTTPFPVAPHRPVMGYLGLPLLDSHSVNGDQNRPVFASLSVTKKQHHLSNNPRVRGSLSAKKNGLTYDAEKGRRSNNEAASDNQKKKKIQIKDEEKELEIDPLIMSTAPLGPDPSILPKHVTGIISRSSTSSSGYTATATDNNSNNNRGLDVAEFRNLGFLQLQTLDWEKWSGSVFSNSPPPSCVPLPNFPSMQKMKNNASSSCNGEAGGVVDIGATYDLRRLLRLDCAR